ncbi:MAG TPA: hypothetical protein VMX96_03970 [Dehalococcoidia bacterium]|nr:hypothetical protein [Dehalococcoidia bacterium]
MWIPKKYKKKLEKRYSKTEIGRKQLNFACDVVLIDRFKFLAEYLETPLYTLAEHALELGLGELAITLQDKALTEFLQRHLLKEHLLVGQLSPVDKHVSDRVRRINNALKFLKFVEVKAGNPEAVEKIIDRIIKEG